MHYFSLTTLVLVFITDSFLLITENLSVPVRLNDRILVTVTDFRTKLLIYLSHAVFY